MKISYFRKMVGALLIISFGGGAVFADDYCNGYEEGYKVGYHDTVRTSSGPMVPICPPQPIGQLDQPERDYRDGYNQGYKEGQEKAKEEQ